MNKIRDKFEEIIDNSINDFSSKWQSHEEKSDGITENAEQCEQITDDFSVRFALWLANCEDIDFVDAENEEESVKQLLQIFKTKYYGKE